MPKLNVRVVIRNRQNFSTKIRVGLTVGKNIGGSGCGLYTWGEYYDLRGTDVTLGPLETKEVLLTYDISLTKGTWYLIAKLWYGNECLDGASASFTV